MANEVPKNLSERLQAFYDYWISKHRNGQLPSRNCFDPTEIPDLLPGICILNLEISETRINRVKFRLAGTELYEMIGYDVTGKYVDEIIPDDVYAEVLAQFDYARNTGQPVYRRFHWHDGPRREVVYERLLVPVRDDREDDVLQLIGMHNIISAPKTRHYSQIDGLNLPIG